MKAVIYTKEWYVNYCDADYLNTIISDAIKNSGHVLLKKTEHRFKPYGYTALYLIAESHVAVHTFPEENKTFVQISSCNKHKYDTFVKIINLELQK